MINQHTGLYIKQIAVAMMWGGTFVAGRILSQELPPLLSAVLRFSLASFLLVLLVFYTHKKWVFVSKKSLLITALMGLTGIFAYNLFFFSALAKIEAGHTALFVSLSPILTVLFAQFLFNEKLKWLNYIGVALAFFGTFIVVTRGDFATPLMQSIGLGELFMCGAVLSWVCYTLLNRKNTELTPLLTITYASLWGTLFLWLNTFLHLEIMHFKQIPLPQMMALFYVGALGTVLSFIWYAQGIAQLGASKTVVFTNLVPVFAVLLSYLILDEKISWSMLVGGVLIFSGIYLTNKKFNKPT
ncbi:MULTISPECIES: DMT family transporter [unclassified Acinetobacter]|uniref:DMT family transporter n=1 Tax=unclassified Acinetobacter TaxID=196816 RepID=UPI0035BAAA04